MSDERPTFGSLFAGIGGIDLGLERAGWRGRWQVEYEPFCQRVLAKHWPDVHRVGDVHDAHGADFCPTLADADAGGRDGWSGEQRPAGRGEPANGGDVADTSSERGSARGPEVDEPPRPDGVGGSGELHCPNCLPYVDLIAGGFPCQPVSFAGRRQIQDDDRWLWPEFARCIRELRPRYVLVENVPGLLVGGGMDDVLGGLAELGYDCEWESIPAEAVGAPHLRYRVWLIAYPNRESQPSQSGDAIAGRGVLVPRGEVAYANGLGQGRTPTLGPSSLTGSRPQGAGTEPHGAGARAMADADHAGLQGHGRRGPDGSGASQWPAGAGGGALEGQWLVEPDVGRVAHGVPARVDRLRALGNAVVPQVVEFIGRRILEAEAEVAA